MFLELCYCGVECNLFIAVFIEKEKNRLAKVSFVESVIGSNLSV